MGRKFSLFVSVQSMILVCLILVGLLLLHESRLLHKSVRNLQHASDMYASLGERNQQQNTNRTFAESVNKNKTEETNINRDAQPKKSSRASGVVIFTTMRAGSSFVGELFNRHGQIFYSFEPLHAFGSRPNQADRRFQAISDVMSCDFVHLASLYQQANASGDIVADHSALCVRDNFCFKSKTQYLRRNSTLCSPKCKVPFDPQQLSELCRSSLLPVAKIIVELDIRQVQKILEDDTRDVRLIHLVRDPRGIMASRREVFTSYDGAKPYSVVKQSSYLCAHTQNNLRWAQCSNTNSTAECNDVSEQKKWEKKYLQLRFEDVSLKPLQTAKRIYDFVGIDFDPAVRKWILENTKDTSDHHDLFGTGRNSLAAVARWKKSLSFDEVTAIQERCATVMKTLNYKNVFNESQLQDDTLNLWW